MNIVKKIGFGIPLLRVSYLEKNQFSVLTTTGMFKLLEYKDKEICDIRSIQLKNLPDNSHLTDICHISNSGEYLIFPEKDRRAVKVYDFLTKKPIARVDWHKGAINVLAYDAAERFFATGGEDGRAYIWSAKNGKLLASLMPHNDYVTVIAFSKNSNWVATGSYDRKINVTNTLNLETTKVLKGGIGKKIALIEFISGERIVSVDIDGSPILWDLTTSERIKTLPKTKAEPLSITFVDDDRYMILCDKHFNVYLYDLETLELITSTYITLTGVKSVSFMPEEDIFILRTDDDIHLFSLKEEEERLVELLEKKEYYEAEKILLRNTILANRGYSKEFEESWDKNYAVAVKLISHGRKDDAKKVMSPFQRTKSKAQLIVRILNGFEEFEKFKLAISKQNYALAYNIAHGSLILMDTPHYQALENKWKKHIEFAKKVVMSNEINIDQHLKKLLDPFRGISDKKEKIKNFFEGRDAMMKFTRYLKQSKYHECFLLVKKFVVLTEFKEYEELLLFGDAIYKRMKGAEKKENYEQALKLAMELIVFPPYTKEMQELIEKYKKSLEFQDAYSAEDIERMLLVASSYPFLEENSVFLDFNHRWDMASIKAEEYVAKANPLGVINALKHYTGLSIMQKRIVTILSAAYVQQLNYLAKSTKGDEAEIFKAINRYVNIFGKNSNLDAFIDHIGEKWSVEYPPGKIPETAPDYTTWKSIKLPSKLF